MASFALLRYAFPCFMLFLGFRYQKPLPRERLEKVCYLRSARVTNNNRSKVCRQFLPGFRNARPATLIPTSFSFISSIRQNVNVTLLLLCWCRERTCVHYT